VTFASSLSAAVGRAAEQHCDGLEQVIGKAAVALGLWDGRAETKEAAGHRIASRIRVRHDTAPRDDGRLRSVVLVNRVMPFGVVTTRTEGLTVITTVSPA
jgi:hypothetical protein